MLKPAITTKASAKPFKRLIPTPNNSIKRDISNAGDAACMEVPEFIIRGN